MKSISIVFFSIISFNVFTQQLNLVTGLNDMINETSGLTLINDKLITHNDSGSLPNLYEIDTLSGVISRTIHISNAQNIDWEDITRDDDFIYVGDFGNNNGSRIDLTIYRISIDDYLSSDTVTADAIQFSYAEQTDFTPAPFATNFDAEAMLSFEDSLYIFSKNWENQRCYVYALPKTQGAYSRIKCKTWVKIKLCINLS